MSAKKPIYKIWWFWVIVVFAVLLCVGMVRTHQNEPEQDEPEANQPPTSSQKCVAMEAADLYNTGATDDIEVAFEKAKTSCKEWKRDWGDEQFDEVVEMDWEDRQTEQIEGKQLTEYLDDAK